MSANKRSKSLIMILSILFILTEFTSFSMAEAMSEGLKFGHYFDDNSPMGKAARQFAQAVDQQSKGQIRIELHPHSQLGTPQKMLKNTQNGSVDITLAPIIYLQSYAPKLDILELPFLFRDYDEVDRIFNTKSRISQVLLEGLDPANLKGLALWETGFRDISNSRRPIKGPWDLKGLKIRTYSNKALMHAFKLLGASPVSVPYASLFQALQTGAVDGQEGSIDSFYRLKLYQTQKYYCYTRHLYTAIALVMNSKKFKQLNSSLQNTILSAAREAADYERELSRSLENDNISRLENMGLQIENNPDWDGFRKRVFYEVQGKFVREDGRHLLKEIDRALH